MVLLPNDEEVANSSKKHTQFKTRVHNRTLFQTKTAKKNIPFGTAHTYIAYTRDYLPGKNNALQIMSLAANTSETNKSHCFNNRSL